MLKEPITAITDFLLFIMDYTFAIILLTIFFTTTNYHSLYWGLFFSLNAFGAFCGVITHGLNLSQKWDIIWSKITISVLGISMYFFLLAAMNTYSNTIIQKYWFIPLLLLFIYLIVVFFRYHFLIFVIFSLISIIASLFFYTFFIFSNSASLGLSLIISGILLSIVAGGIQASGIKIAMLNHNDLFHIVQIIALLIMFNGIIKIS